MTGNISTNRIILAREARGLSQGELATAIGMSATNLSKIERGDVGIQDELLEQIATHTHYPTTFFYAKGNVVMDSLSYRKRLQVPQKQLTQINAMVNVLKEQVQLLQNAVAKTTANCKAIKAKTPEQAAIALRKQWEVDTPIISNIVKLIEGNGIPIAAINFPSERVDSCAILTDDKRPILIYNDALLGDRQRFTLAYELGQLIMYTLQPQPIIDDYSHDANAFAAAFLMPAEYIIKDFEHGVTIPILSQLKTKWKVSMISLLYRANDLGVIDDNQKRYLIQQFNQLKIRRREPIELDVPKETPRLIKQYLAQYKTKTKLSTIDMAAVLCMHVDEYMEQYL